MVFYDKALVICQNNSAALTGKGRVLDELGNYTGAMVFYDKACLKVVLYGSNRFFLYKRC